MSTPSVTRTRISFASDAATCAGILYTPSGATSRLPCIVMANGFSGTMDWILPGFAERFAAAGLAVLTFDYRHLGESGGEPRQIVDVREQRADLLHAVAYARRAERLDPERIALWGTSLGGSHVVEHAARDARIAALVLNMPALDALQGGNLAEKLRRTGTSRPRAVAAAARLLGAAVLDAVRGALGRSPYYVAVYGAPGQAFFADESLAGRFEAVAAGSPTWQNRVAPRFLFQVPRYREGTMEKIAAPILVTLAADDVEVSGTFVRAKVSKARRVEIREYAGGHFDLYHGPLFEQVVAEQTAFLRAHLA